MLLAALGGAAYWFYLKTPEPETTAVEPAPPAPVEEEPAEEPEEVAEAPDVPSTGAISIRASESGAVVYIDGERVGEAPFEREDYPIGSYEVRVEKDGFVTFTESLRLRPGRRAELFASLDVLPPSLRIVSDIPGATVFLDRNYAGTTPVDIPDLKPGEHQLTVSAEGYDMHVETVELTTGLREVNVSFQAKAADFHETIQVVHKHRFGSCEGTLIADANGIRYETSDDDAFQTPYANLEQFEVDYIEKNLNLKVRGGRNYNFTEKSGNADALFVFHKNVQDFREGL